MRFSIACTALFLFACGGPRVVEDVPDADTPDAARPDAARPDAARPDAAGDLDSSVPDTSDASVYTVTLTASSTVVIDETPLVLTAVPMGSTSTVVNFFDGTNRVASDTTSPFEASLTFTQADNGMHVFHAIASNELSETASSAAVLVDVRIPRGNYVDPVAGDDTFLGTRAAPFASIHHAAAVAQAGETIFLLDGDYQAPNDVWNLNCLQIPPGVSVRAVHAGAVHVVGPPPGSPTCALVFRGDGELSGVDFDGFSFAVQFRGGTTTVRDVHVTNGESGFAVAETGHAIIYAPQSGSLVSSYRATAFGVSVALIDDTGDLTLRNGVLEGDVDFAGGMILARGNGRVQLDGVTIRNNNKPALLVYDNADAILNDTVIENSSSLGLSGTSIALGPQNTQTPLTPTLDLERSRIDGSLGQAIAITYYGMTDSAISVIVRDSQLTNSGNHGIFADGAMFNVSPQLHLTMTVANSTISGSGSDGISAALADLTISDSHIVGSGAAGVRIGSSAKASSLLMRGVELGGNIGDGVAYEAGLATCDLGSALDPGRNHFAATMAGTTGLRLADDVSCTGGGNDWLPNEQGADGAGHYPGNVAALGPASGLNYVLGMGSSLAF